MKLLIKLTLFTVIFSSCKKDPIPYAGINSNGFEYNGGDGNVSNNEDIIIDFDIENNLNVDGQVEITADVSIGNSFNLNDSGKAIVDIPWEDDTVYIDGNANLNDSLIVLNGFVWINGNLNINTGGVINVNDNADLQVDGDINNSGDIYGNRNVNVNGSLNQNAGSINEAPLY